MVRRWVILLATSTRLLSDKPIRLMISELLVCLRKFAAREAWGGSAEGLNLTRSHEADLAVGFLGIVSSLVGGLKKEEPKEETGTPYCRLPRVATGGAVRDLRGTGKHSSSPGSSSRS